MSRKGCGITPGAAGVSLDDVGDRLAGQRINGDSRGFVDRTKQPTAFDTCRVQPSPERLYWTSNITAGDCDALTFLVGLAFRIVTGKLVSFSSI